MGITGYIAIGDRTVQNKLRVKTVKCSPCCVQLARTVLLVYHHSTCIQESMP